MKNQPAAGCFLALLATVMVVGSSLQAGASETRPGAPPDITVVLPELPAEALQLGPDPRPWTEKITPDLLARATAWAGEVACVATLREPEALRERAASFPGDPVRVRWIAESAEKLGREWAAFGVRLSRTYSHLPVAALTVPAGFLEALAADPRIDALAPDRRVQALRAEGTALIHAPVVHGLGYTGTGVGVAVVDTGVDYTHVELSPGASPPAQGKVIKLFDAIDGDSDPMDKEGHGTSVAGIAAGSALGVAPAATVVAVRVLDSQGGGTDSEVLAGLNAVLASVTGGNPYKIRVLNMSLGGYDPLWPPNTGSCDAVIPAYKTAFSSLTSAGVLIVTAAGNGGCTSGVGLPACASDAMAVGAVYDADIGRKIFRVLFCKVAGCQDWLTQADMINCYSDSGEKLDVWAPSLNAKTPTALNKANGCSCENGTYDCCFGGTSAAAPYVAGAAALLFQAAPAASPATVRQALKSTGKPITDARNGITRNRIDVQDALARLLGNCPAPARPTGVTSSKGSVCMREPFVMSWTPVAGAASYTVSLAGNAAFANARDVVATAPSLTLSSEQKVSATFFVRVRANVSCGAASAWSDAIQITYIPTCGNVAYLRTYFVPGVAHTPGVAPAFWYSDLSVVNPSPLQIELRLTFYGQATVALNASVPAHEQLAWTDVLSGLFALGANDVGAVVVESTAPVVVSVRTYSRVGEGANVKTFGQSFQGLEATQALGWGHLGILAGLRSDDPFRTNVELLNPGSSAVQVELRFFDGTGVALGGPVTRTVPALHRLAVNGAVPVGVASAYAEVRVLNAGGLVIASGSVVDGSSTDPTTIPLVVP